MGNKSRYRESKSWRYTLYNMMCYGRWANASAAQVLHALAACTAFMLLGPALMLLNKHIMQRLKFDYPLSLSGIGLLASATVIRGLVCCGALGVREESREAVAGALWFRRALPIGVAKALTLAAGNAAYLYLGLGFIQMLKAFTPVFVVGVMRAFNLAPPSRPALWAVYLIIAGTLVEVKGELKPTALGVGLMLFAEFMEALNLVLTQKLLQNSKFTVVEGMHTLAPPGAGCLFAMAAAVEWPRMAREGKYHIIAEHPWHFAAAGLLGVVVNFLSLAVVQATSSLTLKILNPVRSTGLVVVGVWFYGEHCPSLQVLGYSVALLGFFGYNWAQMWPEDAERLEHRLCGPSRGHPPAAPPAAAVEGAVIGVARAEEDGPPAVSSQAGEGLRAAALDAEARGEGAEEDVQPLIACPEPLSPTQRGA